VEHDSTEEDSVKAQEACGPQHPLFVGHLLLKTGELETLTSAWNVDPESQCTGKEGEASCAKVQV